MNAFAFVGAVSAMRDSDTEMRRRLARLALASLVVGPIASMAVGFASLWRTADLPGARLLRSGLPDASEGSLSVVETGEVKR